MRDSVIRRINRRRKSLASNPSIPRTLFDENWITEQRKRALKTLRSFGKRSFIEAAVAPLQNELAWTLDVLHTASFPIISSPLMGGRTTEKRFVDGIAIENVGEQGDWYAYWTFQRDGRYYTLASLPEETRSVEGALSARRRIVQMAWLVVCCQWFYEGLALPTDSLLDIEVRHSGLRNRTLRASRYTSEKIYGPSAEDTITSVAKGKSLADIVHRPEQALKQLVSPLFEVFGFPMPEDAYFKSSLGALLTGRIALWSPE